MASLLLLTLIPLAMLAAAADASTKVTRFTYVGTQNVFPRSTANHEVYDVGAPEADELVSMKKCAGWCSATDWCGAMYVSYQDNLCHIVPEEETSEEHTAIYPVGPGHVFYVRSLKGPGTVTIADESSLLM